MSTTFFTSGQKANPRNPMKTSMKRIAMRNARYVVSNVMFSLYEPNTPNVDMMKMMTPAIQMMEPGTNANFDRFS